MKQGRASVRFTAYWGFIVLGIGTTLLGPALLSILGAFHITPSGAGALFVSATIGYTVAVLVGGPAGDHWGKRELLMAGAAIYAVGLLGFCLAPTWPLAVAAMLVSGVGSGVVDSGTNALANDIASPEGHATEQSMLHAFFGLGALAGPLLIGAFLAVGFGWRPAFALSSVGAFVLFVLYARMRLPARAVPSARVSVRSVATLAGNRFVVLLAFMIGLYVGAELLVGDWAATYLQRLQHLGPVAAANSIGLFWGGLTFGRIISAVVARRISGHMLLLGTIALSFLASLALVLAPNSAVALVALTVCGIGYAPIFPLVMAIAGEIFPEATGSLAGLLTAAASVAGAAFPFLGGFLVQYADARAALVPSVFASAGLLVAGVLLRRAVPHAEASRDASAQPVSA